MSKPKVLVDMSKSPTRDNSMYMNLDPDYIKSVKKERRMRNFTLNDYLPNSLKHDRSLCGMYNDATSVGSGLLNTQKSKKQQQAMMTVTSQGMSVHKSGSMNRLASLSEMDPLHDGEQHLYMGGG